MIGGKLVLITNRKSHMSFPLVPNSGDLEWRNSLNFALFTPYFLRQKCRPKNLVFSDISFIAIFVEVTEKECITEN